MGASDGGSGSGWRGIDEEPGDGEDGFTTRQLLLGGGILVTVVLVVAVVAGLFAATFILGAGTSPERSPVATIDFERNATNDTVRMTHNGGDSFTEDNTGELFVLADDTRVGTVSFPFEAGDTVRLDDVGPGTTVRLVWESPEDDVTKVIAEYEVPDSPAGSVE